MDVSYLIHLMLSNVQICTKRCVLINGMKTQAWATEVHDTWYQCTYCILTKVEKSNETIDRGRVKWTRKFRFWGVTGFSQDSVYISKLVREDRDLFVRSQSILMQIMIYHPLSSPIAEAKAGTAPITEHTAFMSSLSFLQIERLFSFQVCSMSWTYVMSGLYCRWWRRS